MASLVRLFVHRLTRRKCIDFTTSERHTLERCLTTLDLTALGIACTLGSGTYIIAGQVARYPSGPAVILSFVVAGFASVLAGLCYAEFGARVPKAGSAYIYSYVTVGELWAFIIGWNLILEYVIGTASIARAFTPYIDAVFVGNPLSSFFKEYLPLHVSMLSEYVDLLAFALCLVFTVLLCLGVQESTVINNMLTVVNLGLVAYVIICGLFKADIRNWQIPKSENFKFSAAKCWINSLKTRLIQAVGSFKIVSAVLVDLPGGNETIYGVGGFFPYGISGMLQGSATCFYAFVGFDVIATTGEEVINPQKAIPMSILLSLLMCAMCYIGLSTVLTLMVPYYLMDKNAPLPHAFVGVGYSVATWFVAVGALASFLTCLLTTMFPMPRIIFAMSRDGLLFKFLAHINRRFKTPDYATIVSGLLAGIMAMFFDLQELVAMMSIGTLLAYTLVAVCVLILRYEYSGSDYVQIQVANTSCCSCNGVPTRLSSLLVKIAVFCVCLVTVALGLLEIYFIKDIELGRWWAILSMVLPIVILIILIVFIACQPQSNAELAFRVPFVPVLPTVSIIMNIYLMLKLSRNTWIRFGIWLAVGFVIYFSYGIRHGGDQTTVAPSLDVDEDEDTEARQSLVVSQESSSVNVNERTHLISKPVQS